MSSHRIWNLDQKKLNSSAQSCPPPSPPSHNLHSAVLDMLMKTYSIHLLFLDWVGAATVTMAEFMLTWAGREYPHCIRNVFTDVPCHSRCMGVAMLWLSEFSGVVLRCFTLDCSDGWYAAEPNRKTRSTHCSRQFFIQFMGSRKKFNTFLTSRFRFKRNEGNRIKVYWKCEVKGACVRARC